MKVQRTIGDANDVTGAEFDVTVHTAEYSVPETGHGPAVGTVVLSWTIPHGRGDSLFRLTLDQRDLIRLLNDTLVTPGSTCEHPGLFASGAPYMSDFPTMDEYRVAYHNWLDMVRRCEHCGADVAMRDL